MQLTFMQISDAYDVLKELSTQKLPFRLSFLISRNLAALKDEYEFYLDQEQKFISEYLVINYEKGELEQIKPGVFKIQEGKENDCVKAREDLDNFKADLDIRKIPISLLETINFSPAQLLAIDFMIEEEEEHD